MVSYCLDAFRASGVQEIVLAAPPAEVEDFRRLIAGGPGPQTEKVVAGGATRQESVINALRELSAGIEYVLIHDAARPLVSPRLIDACAAAARAHGAAVAALPLCDTIKDAQDQVIRRTLNRQDLWAAQTPQAFRVELVAQAYARAQRAGIIATDDASLVEAMGVPVRLVMGSPRNLKVTYPADLALAQQLVQSQRGMRETRCGIGYDIHRLVAGRRLVLGGVEFREHFGLEGHSDADVLTHAICDALLGAAGLGDIGRHFPDSDPRYAGADSIELLRRTAAMAAAAGFRAINVDAVVVAEKPRIADRVARMQQRLGAALGLPAERVNIKGKTAEGLGVIGAGAAIASHAVCTVAPREMDEDQPSHLVAEEL